MNRVIRGVLLLVSIGLLSACSSSNIRRFNPDPLQKKNIERMITKKLAVKVSMSQGDRDSIMCRMAGNVYLPSKMTYSKYVDDAFRKVLLSADRLSEHGETGNPVTLFVDLTKVDFSSTSGKWYIDADVKLNDKTPVRVSSTTSFGTSWDATSACNNAANAFDEAVAHFINEVLSTPGIQG